MQIPVDPIGAPPRKIRRWPSLRISRQPRPRRMGMAGGHGAVKWGSPVEFPDEQSGWLVTRGLHRGEFRQAESPSLLDALRMVGPRWMCPKEMRHS